LLAVSPCLLAVSRSENVLQARNSKQKMRAPWRSAFLDHTMDCQTRRQQQAFTSGSNFLRPRANNRRRRRFCTVEVRMHSFSLAGVLVCLSWSAPGFAADMSIPESLEKGTIRFVPRGDQKLIPERYRLGAHTFDFELSKRLDLPNADIDVHHLRFPSPLHSDTTENNTVHGEYYRPRHN